MERGLKIRSRKAVFPLSVRKWSGGHCSQRQAESLRERYRDRVLAKDQESQLQRREPVEFRVRCRKEKELGRGMFARLNSVIDKRDDETGTSGDNQA
jgi:hypothetical protein